jgi:hypothetical protein
LPGCTLAIVLEIRLHAKSDVFEFIAFALRYLYFGWLGEFGRDNIHGLFH